MSDGWQDRMSPDRQEGFSERAQPLPRFKLMVWHRQRSGEEDVPFGTRVRNRLRTSLLSLAVVGGTIMFGVGPLLAGFVLLGKQLGVPAGAAQLSGSNK